MTWKQHLPENGHRIAAVLRRSSQGAETTCFPGDFAQQRCSNDGSEPVPS